MDSTLIQQYLSYQLTQNSELLPDHFLEKVNYIPLFPLLNSWGLAKSCSRAPNTFLVISFSSFCHSLFVCLVVYFLLDWVEICSERPRNSKDDVQHVFMSVVVAE